MPFSAKTVNRQVGLFGKTWLYDLATQNECHPGQGPKTPQAKAR